MKKLIVILLVLAAVLAWAVWGQGRTYTVQVTVPAGTVDEFVYIEDFIYSDEEISPQKKPLGIEGNKYSRPHGICFNAY